MRRSLVVATIIVLAASWPPGQAAVELTGSPDSVRFVVIGDNGTAGDAQYEPFTAIARAL